MRLHHFVISTLLFVASASLGSVAHADSLQNLEAKALSGDAKAQFELAKMYEDGRANGKADIAYALSWYEEAARNGLKVASYRIKMLGNQP